MPAAANKNIIPLPRVTRGKGRNRLGRTRGPPTLIDNLAELNKAGHVWIIRPRYKVERICGMRVYKGKWRVLVKWHGIKKRSYIDYECAARDMPELVAAEVNRRGLF